jgi:alcohol dehydrogenase/L-iditol 2-dehydrogenase
VEPGRIVVDDVPEPEFGPGDVRIAVGGVGLCGSDMSVFLGKWQAPHYPWIMGHEAFGVIERVGVDVDEGRLGDVVVIEPNVACQDCPECGQGRTSACRRRQSLGMYRQGALAEKVVVPARLAWPIDHPEARDLVCVEPLAIVDTALHRLPTPLPETALVIGAGAQGLLMSLALLGRGVDVQVTDLNPDRVTFASQTLGARSLQPDDDRVFEFIVDTTGAPDAVAEAMRRSAVGATILELGLEKRPLELSAETLVRRQIVLRGSLTYDHPQDFRRVTSLVESRAVSPGRVISDEHPLPAAQRAFEASQAARGKTWIRLAEPG